MENKIGPGRAATRTGAWTLTPDNKDQHNENSKIPPPEQEALPPNATICMGGSTALGNFFACSQSYLSKVWPSRSQGAAAMSHRRVSGGLEPAIEMLIVYVDEYPHAYVVSGRNAWALLELMNVGEHGCTPLENPAPRWSADIHSLRTAGVEIETIRERHSGPYPAALAHYILRTNITDVEVIESDQDTGESTA